MLAKLSTYIPRLSLGLTLLIASEISLAERDLEPCEISFLTDFILQQIDGEHVLPPTDWQMFAASVLEVWFAKLDPFKEYLLAEEVNSEIELLSKSLFEDLDRMNLGPYFRLVDLIKGRADERLRVIREQMLREISFESGDRYSPLTGKIPYPNSLQEAATRTMSRLKFHSLHAKYAHFANIPLNTILRNSFGTLAEEIANQNSLSREEYIKLLVKSIPESLDAHSSVQISVHSRSDILPSVDTETRPSFGLFLYTKPGKAPFVHEVVESSPAAQSGLIAVGDRILAIKLDSDADWISYDQLNLVDTMRIDAKDSVQLRILRKSDQSIQEVEIHRDIVQSEIERVVASVVDLPGNRQQAPIKLGLVKVPSFYRYSVQRGGREVDVSTSEDVKAKLESDEFQDVDAVVLDFRGNSGGFLGEAYLLVGLFTDRYLFRSLSQHEKDFHKGIPSGALNTKKVIVLIDHKSASAAEVSAGALQDSGRALIIGNRSFGKSSVQTSLNFGVNLENDEVMEINLRLTTQIMYRRSGLAIQRMGIIPDVSLPPLRFPNDFYERDDNQSLVAPKVFRIKPVSSNPAFNIAVLNERSRKRRKKDERFSILVQGNREVDQLLRRNEFSLTEADLPSWYPEDYLDLVVDARFGSDQNYGLDTDNFYTAEILAIIRDHLELLQTQDGPR